MQNNYPRFTEKYIESLTSLPTSYGRGKTYYKEGRVLSLTHSKEYVVFQANVQGSLDEPYKCKLRFYDDKLTSHSCDCPAHGEYGGICKHIVAAMLQVREERLEKDREIKKAKELAAQPSFSLGGESEIPETVISEPEIVKRKRKRRKRKTVKKKTANKTQPPVQEESYKNNQKNDETNSGACLLGLVAFLVLPIIAGISMCASDGVSGFFGGLIGGIILEVIALFIWNLFH